MRYALAFHPRHGPLQDARPLAAIAFLGAFIVAALSFSSPLVLAGAGAAVALTGVLAGARPALRVALRYGVALGIVIVAVNALVNHRGETILLRGWELPLLGPTAITLESIAAGSVIALRIIIVVAAFAVYSVCVDPDRVLAWLRPVARRSALTATLVARSVPLAASDLSRLRAAAKLRGPAAAPANRTALARRLVAGALDRSVDAAATLELRGYASGARAAAAAQRSRHDAAFLTTGLFVVALCAAARLTGVGGFEPFPTVTLDTGAATLALAAALPALAAVPFGLGALRSRPRVRRGPRRAAAAAGGAGG